MDTAVALVQAYLQVNGYFTVVEYPVLESLQRGSARTVTDLDILAFRFPQAGHEVVRRHKGERLDEDFEPDPALGCPPDQPDMIVGEVKEGLAGFNPAAMDPAVLEVALARFGCCPRAHAGDVARRLLSRGRVQTRTGHSVRLVAFGTTSDQGDGHRWTTISMGHVLHFLQRYLRDHWDILRHAQVKGTALGLLTLIEKCAPPHLPSGE